MKANIPRALTADVRNIVYSVFDLNLLGDLIIPFQAAKDKEYQSHWAHRGLMGYIHGCIMRQVDRVEPGFENLLATAEFDESGHLFDESGAIAQTNQTTLAAASVLDTLLDVAVYALLGICMVSALFPKAGEAFKQKMLHRVLNGLDMANTDLDLYSTNGDVKDLAAKLAQQYRERL